MKQQELENLSKNELLDIIKDQSKDVSKGALAIGAVAIALLLMNLTSGNGLPLLWVLMLFACLFAFWRSRKTMQFDNPGEFIAWHDNVDVKEKWCYRAFAAVAIVMFGNLLYKMISGFSANSAPLALKLFLIMIVVVAIAYLIYFLIKGKTNPSDDHINRLRELVKND